MAKKYTSSSKKKANKNTVSTKDKKLSKKIISKKSKPVKKKVDSKKINTKKSKPLTPKGVVKKASPKKKASGKSAVKQASNTKKISPSKKTESKKNISAVIKSTVVNQKSKSPALELTKTNKNNSAKKNPNVSAKKNDLSSGTAVGGLPPGAFELEYVVHASAELLFSFLTEPSGLSEWFCDDVNIRNGIYTFFWDGTSQQAREVKVIQDKVLRLQWLDKSDNSFFEYRIEKDDLTGDISLIITDFAESADEKQSSKLLWNSQIDKLLHVLGAYF